MRPWVWVLVAGGAIALLHMLTAAVSGTFSPGAQLDFLTKLGLWGFVAFILLEALFRGAGEAKQHDDWTRFAGAVPLLSMIVLFGGVWLWWVYFGRHNATLIWFVMIGVALAGLATFRRQAQRQWDQKRRDEALKPPEMPNTSGAAKPEDYKDWS